MNPLAAIASMLSAPQGGQPNERSAPLRDRFHQLRGDKFRMTEGSGHGMKIAQDFLRSRGVPITQQNMTTALNYLRGGQLDGLSAEDASMDVEGDIADAAIAAEGGPRRAPVTAQAQAQTQAPTGDPTSYGVDPTPETPPESVDMTAAANSSTSGGTGNGTDILPWMLPLLAVAAGEGQASPGTAVQKGPFTGEVLNDLAVREQAGIPAAASRMGDAVDDATVVGVNPARTDNALPAPSSSPDMPIDMDTSYTPPSVREGMEQVTNARAGQARLPAPQEPQAPPAKAPSRGKRNTRAKAPAEAPKTEKAPKTSARKGRNAPRKPDPAVDAPISTEDVMPKSSVNGDMVASGSVDTSNGPLQYEVYRTDNGYIAATEQGQVIRGTSPAMLRRILQGL